MPSIFKNTQPVRLVLKGDMNESPQPAFLVRRLTFGQLKAFTGLMNRFGTEDNIEEVFNDLQSSLDDAVVRFEHMGSYEVGKDSVADFLSASEVMELTMLILKSAQVKDDEGN